MEKTATVIRLDWSSLFPVAVLAIIIILVFGGLRSAQFIDLDDNIYVGLNPHVLSGLSVENIGWDFTNHDAALWIPLTWLSLQVDATVSGGKIPGGPPGPVAPFPDATVYHVDNVLQHSIVAVILFLFLWRATGMRWPSFAATLIWAIHPLRVESVAWVTERKDVLSGIFGFLAAYLYVRWAERPSTKRMLAASAALALSLMAKSTFVTLPFALVLLDYWPLGRWDGRRGLTRRVAEKWPLFLLAILFCGVQYYAMSAANYDAPAMQIPLSARVGNALLFYAEYLRIHFDIGRLAFFYPYPQGVSVWQYMGAGVMVLGISAVAFLLRRRWPWVIVGWLWFVGTLVPMIGIVQAGEQGYADRYTYLPSVGLCVVFAWLLPRSRWRWVSGGIWGALVVVLVTFSVIQVGYWDNSIAIARRAIEVTRQNATAYVVLGTGYLRMQDIDRAIAAYEMAVKLKPTDETARSSLGITYLWVHRFPEAVRELTAAVQYAPKNPNMHSYLGFALAHNHEMRAAVAEYRIAHALAPGDVQTERALARAEQQLEKEEGTATRQGAP